MKYEVHLTNGDSFTGERPWWSTFTEGTGMLTFRHIVKNGETVKLHVPKTSIFYIEERQEQSK